jgi:polar amino acid transport system substrate-binding protein
LQTARDLGRSFGKGLGEDERKPKQEYHQDSALTEGYQKTLNENNTVLFTTFQIPEREQLFKWVGPVASGRDVLLVKSDKNISITAPEDLEKYKIGAIENDIALQRLLNYGLKKKDLISEPTSKPIIEMLKNGTIDAWAYNDLAGIWLIQQSGAKASDYKIAYVLDQGDGYYAFNKGTPDSLVQSFQLALDYIKSNKDKDGVTDYEGFFLDTFPCHISPALRNKMRPNHYWMRQ